MEEKPLFEIKVLEEAQTFIESVPPRCPKEDILQYGQEHVLYRQGNFQEIRKL